MQATKIRLCCLILSFLTLVSCGGHDDSPYITELQLTAEQQAFPAGLSTSLTSIVYYSDGTTLKVSPEWQSSDKSIAIVNTDGSQRVTGVSPGNVTMTATYGAFVNSIDLTVTDAQVVDIYISPASTSTNVGFNLQYSASATFTDNSQHDVTFLEGLTWVSNDNAIASINTETAIAHGVAEGLAEITVIYNDARYIAVAPLRVNQRVVESLEITPTEASVPNGYNTAFSATATYSDGEREVITNNVDWYTSDASIANTASPRGSFVGKSIGSTNIWATAYGINNSTVKSNEAKLTVTDAVVERLVINSRNDTLPVALPVQYSVDAYFSDSTRIIDYQSAHWQSSDINKATIDENGLALGIQLGKVTISAQANNGVNTHKDSFVTPASLVSLSISPFAPFIATDSSIQFIATGEFSDGSIHNVTRSPYLNWGITNTAISTTDGHGLVHNINTESQEYTSEHFNVTYISPNIHVEVINNTFHLPFTEMLDVDGLTFIGTFTREETADIEDVEVNNSFDETGVTGPENQSYTTRDFRHALNFCDALSYDGFDDYRLPSLAELEALYHKYEDEDADTNYRFYQEHKWATGVAYHSIDTRDNGSYVFNLANGETDYILWVDQNTAYKYVSCVRDTRPR